MKLFIWLNLLLSIMCFSGSSFGFDAAQALKEIKSKKAHILDVREFSEIKSGFVEGTLWVPFSDFRMPKKSERLTKVMSHIPKDKKVYIYCAAGGRAGKVAEMLKKMGYKPENAGGFSDLASAEYPVSKVKSDKAESCPWLCSQ